MNYWTLAISFFPANVSSRAISLTTNLVVRRIFEAIRLQRPAASKHCFKNGWWHSKTDTAQRVLSNTRHCLKHYPNALSITPDV